MPKKDAGMIRPIISSDSNQLVSIGQGVASKSLIQIVYVSSAVVPFSDIDLEELLKVSKGNNGRCGVSGLLLYHEGNFMQLLEGPKLQVEALEARIVRDPRHRGYICLLQRQIEQATFAGWSMGFRRLKKEDFPGKPGFSDFLLPQNHAYSSASTANGNRALTLLYSFRSNLR